MRKLGGQSLESDARMLRATMGGFRPLAAPWSHASFDGDAYSTVGASTQLDMSAFTGAPADTSKIRAYLLQVYLRDSGGGSDYYIALGPNATYYYSLQCYCHGGDSWESFTAPVACDANGDLWYRISASGAATMDVVIRVWGFWT